MRAWGGEIRGARRAGIWDSLAFFRGFSMSENVAGLIAQSVEKAAQLLRDEIAGLQEKIAALEAMQATF